MSPISATVVPKRLLRGALAACTLVLALAAAEAHASTAANTRITNTATVSFSDASGVPQPSIVASATVVVTLVPSAPLLSSPASLTISQTQTATLSYTITATANGPDTYNLSANDVRANVTAVALGLPANVQLGATTLAADAADGANAITVPYDGNGNADVNGIAVGETIVVGANTYVVASVAKNAGANTATIGLGAPIAGGTVAAGQIVGERFAFDVTVPSGTVVAGNSGTHTVSTTATSAAAPNPATTQATPSVVTVTRPTLTVTKEVSIDGGVTFGPNASAIPGTVLTYRVVAANGGTLDATAVAFTDSLPPYLTYVPGSARFATDGAATYAGGTALTEGAGGYTYVAPTVAYDPGGATGTVAGGAALVLFYQATIN